ncbi:CvpA family protein, partial [Blautia schinkii]|uniref:CvpA family protein n=1 Tax=Blautia schinkii TaxID=180164 RepID=UPI0023B1EF09
MEITLLGILAIAILIFTGYGGYRKGFVREIMSFFFVFLGLELAWRFNPYVYDFMMKITPAYERIQQ